MSLASATFTDEQQFAKPSRLFAAWQRAHQVLRDLFPVKTAACLADITGLSQRGWELSLRERRQFAPDTLVALLNTTHGPALLLALLADSEEPWVGEFREMFERKRLEAQIAELQGRLAALSGGGK